MLLDDTKISLGFLIAMIALGVVTLVCLIGAVVGLVAGEDAEEKGFYAGPFIAIFVVWGLCTAGFCFPYDMDYHQWRKVEGVVYETRGRVLANEDGPSEQFVVTYTDGHTFRCDDSRCAPAKTGDRLTLWCIKEWQWASTPGYGCRFDEMR